jgi:hypothetical protein
MATPTTTRSDDQLHGDVLDELRWDARVQPNEIGLGVTKVENRIDVVG